MEKRRQEGNDGVSSWNIQSFAELMAEVAALPDEQQEKISFFIQGYVIGQAKSKRQVESI